MIADRCRHRPGPGIGVRKGAARPREVVGHVVKRDGLPRGCGASLRRRWSGGEASGAHPKGQIRPLDVAGADPLRVRGAPDHADLLAGADLWAVLAGPWGFLKTSSRRRSCGPCSMGEALELDMASSLVP